MVASKEKNVTKKNVIKDFFNGIVNEAKRIRWPKFSQLMTNTGKVLFFCICFAIFFVLCDFIVSGFLVWIGVGA
ncbi:MAG: preprotein translocase subunit SecE [Erysipelotrichia bacterium]|nr:preprotein translocase subunit SecE [Erysipelotrichia bacterium]